MKKRILPILMVLIIIVPMLPTMIVSAANSSTRIYYNVDLTSGVSNSRILQHVTNDCGVVSMATIEAYMHGATSAADRKKVYEAMIKANGEKVHANWGSDKTGYKGSAKVNWNEVHKELMKGVPVIIHRTTGHYAVVTGYTGSTTKLEADKFRVVDVYRTSSGNLYPNTTYGHLSVKEWRGTGTVDTMIVRRNGISISGLSGAPIKMAINVPQDIHPTGEGHGVYGYITSSSNLNSVQIMIVNAKTGAYVYNKTVNPNATKYLVFNQDANITMAKYAAGEYYYTVIAKNKAGNTAIKTKYFQIGKSWPTSRISAPNITVKFDANGGTGAPAAQTVKFYGNAITLPSNVTKSGYKLIGWTAKRTPDNKWYVLGQKWITEAQMKAGGYSARVYDNGLTFQMTPAWLEGGTSSSPTITYYAQWEKDTTTPHVHVWNSGVVTTKATCKATGVKTYTCSGCGATKTETIAKSKTHTYSNNVDGTCNVCGVDRATVETRKVTNMFRMYNPNTGEHFYTGSTVERSNLVKAGWKYEGVGFTFPANTGAPVYRLFQPSTGEHLYTMSETEKNNLVKKGWNMEGIAFNSAYDTEAKQHRLHNPNAVVGAYHFTFSTEEKNNLTKAGWEYQGIGWYSCYK